MFAIMIVKETDTNNFPFIGRYIKRQIRSCEEKVMGTIIRLLPLEDCDREQFIQDNQPLIYRGAKQSETGGAFRLLRFRLFQ